MVSTRHALWIVLAAVVIVAAAAAVALVGRSPGYATAPTTAPTTAQGSTTTAPPQSYCTAYAGFSCSDAVFHGGVLSMAFGQSTGSSWASATLQFVPYGQNYTPGFLAVSLPHGLASGKSTTFALSLPGSVANAAAGALLRGYIYANYTTGTGRAAVRAAAINVTAT